MHKMVHATPNFSHFCRATLSGEEADGILGALPVGKEANDYLPAEAQEDDDDDNEHDDEHENFVDDTLPGDVDDDDPEPELYATPVGFATQDKPDLLPSGTTAIRGPYIQVILFDHMRLPSKVSTSK
mmetsp:Transcript_17445/g.56585  ORF Transcript_17445/g.56585 Transcript_17445/m.56585 type:complete len:127 (-) Transcript_17445:371-751(-)